ncbi:MAG: FeoA family protein [Balneolaceae bacterium]|jgi:Fe2+ transport system protein FeoA
MHPLNTTKAGEKINIQCLGCDCQNACRLRELGCVEGVKGKIISNNSNIVLQVGDTRLAISEKLARTILVSLN